MSSPDLRGGDTPPVPTYADVVVIGAGHNGLIAACYLARAGLRVVVVEASATVGGMTASLAPFAGAPRHLVNPCAVDLTFIRATGIVADLQLARFGFRDVEVDPPLLYLADDGASLALWRDPARTAGELRSFSRRDGEAFLELSRTLDALLNVALPFMNTNPCRPGPQALARTAAAAVRRSRELGRVVSFATSTVLELVSERFEHPIIRDALAAISATVTPPADEAGTMPLMFLAFLHRFGASRPIGGMQALPDALAAALRSAGGSVHCGAEVTEIVVSNQRAVGVRLHDGTLITARKAVLAACDPRVALARLLKDGTGDHQVDVRVAQLPAHARGGAWFKVDLALSGQLRLPRHEALRQDQLDLRRPAGVIGTAADAQQNWADAAAGHFPTRPLMYAVIPTAMDPTQAPTGQDTLYLWASPVPARPTAPWDTAAPSGADTLVARAAEFYDGIKDFEIGRWVESPVDAERRLRVAGGSLLHVDISPFRMGSRRPARGLGGYRTPVEGLYLGAAGSHPGGGVWGLPGRLAVREILRRGGDGGGRMRHPTA